MQEILFLKKKLPMQMINIISCSKEDKLILAYYHMSEKWHTYFKIIIQSDKHTQNWDENLKYV